MRYSTEEIKDYVYMLLDENRELLEDRMEYCDPGAQLGPMVIALLPRAAREVILRAAAEEIDISVNLTDLEPRYGSAKAGSTYAEGRLRLPENYLRLLYCRMTDWEEGVTTPIEYGREAHQLRQRWRGGLIYRYIRPGVTVRKIGNNSDLLIYGSSCGSRVAELRYAAIPEVKEDGIELPPGLYHDVCARIAEMISTIMGIKK